MGEAGESAQVKVDRVRRELAETLAKADRLAKRIDGFEAGEEGERTTAKALAALPAEFLVHHDLHIDGSEANVDHVLVGPTGVYVIDSKHWTGRLSAAKGCFGLAGTRSAEPSRIWPGRQPVSPGR